MTGCTHGSARNDWEYQSSASLCVFRHLMWSRRSQRSMWEGRRLAVVMPARNEASHIDTALRTLPHEVDLVVVVDDGSSDGTVEAVQCVERPYEVVVLQRGGQGVGAAVAMGLDHLCRVLDADDLVAVMDGDGQMDPRDLVPLCRHLIAEQADVVKGDRLAHPEVQSSMPMLRRIANRGLAMLTTLASGRRVGDAQCGFVVMRQTVITRSKDDPVWSGYGYVNHRFIRWSRHGFRVSSHPVRPVYGEETSGVRPLRFFFRVGAMFVLEHHGRAFSSLAFGPGRVPLSLALLTYLAGWGALFGVAGGFLPLSFIAVLPTGWALAHVLDRSVHAGGRARI